MGKYCEVVLDTNFLTIPQKFKLDIINEIKKVIPNAKITTIPQIPPELKKLRKGAIGLEMIKKGKVEIMPWESEGNADKALIEYALKNKAVVATNDKELKDQLRKLKVPIIYLRGRKKLEMRGTK